MTPQGLCIEKSLGFVIREITECIGQMRIVYLDSIPVRQSAVVGKALLGGQEMWASRGNSTPSGNSSTRGLYGAHSREDSEG